MPLEHSDNCSFILHREKCNCYMLVNDVLLGPRVSAFLAATGNGPSGYNPPLYEAEQISRRNFVVSKRRDGVSRSALSPTPQLYAPLGQGEVRVLELHSGKFEHSLQGSLHVVSVDFEYPRVDRWKRNTTHAISVPKGDSVWYTALSYTWGPPIFDVTFWFSHTSPASIQITSSLACALRHLRTEQDSVFLWIDQICINQDNIKEKEQQIPLMGLIYSHATNTVIWLGEEGDDDPSLAFDTLQTVHSRLQLSDGETQPDDFRRLDFPAPDAIEWTEVKKLFGRAWFTRLWVVQEAVLSLNPYIKCGKTVVSWEDFTIWCGTVISSGLSSWLEEIPPISTTPFGLKTVYQLSTYRTFNQTQFKPPILDGLVLTRYARASVAKDKVYGVLGIASTSILPRYSDDVSVKDVFLEAALSILPNWLFPVLCCVDHDEPASPSWIPDWSCARVTESLGYSTKSWALYSASGPRFVPKIGKANAVSYALEDNDRSLILPGMLFDTIDSLGEIIEDPVLDITNPACHNRHWMAYLVMLKQFTSYPTGESVWDAFWQTLVAGKNGSFNAKAPQDYSEVFSLIVDESAGQELHIAGQPYSPRRQKGHFTLKSLTARKPKQTLEDMRKAFRAALEMRRFAITKKRYFCLVPRGTKMFDSIVVFQGGNVPFVVRGIEGNGAKRNYELIGETYVHGIMKGEVTNMPGVHFESAKIV